MVSVNSRHIKSHISHIFVLTLFSMLLIGCKKIEPELGWPYPRFDPANTAAQKNVSCALLDQPQVTWQITLNAGDIPFSLFPVSADLDEDGRLEFLLNGWNWNQSEES